MIAALETIEISRNRRSPPHCASKTTTTRAGERYALAFAAADVADDGAAAVVAERVAVSAQMRTGAVAIVDGPM